MNPVIERMQSDKFVASLERGRLMQLKDEECKSLCKKVFEYYDSHVRGELAPRQQKTILQDLHRVVGLKNIDFSPEEFQTFLYIFHNEDRKTLTVGDFEGLAKRLFKGVDSEGALNGQIQQKDLIDFDYLGHKRNENSGKILTGLRECLVRKFGREFLDDQTKLLVNTYVGCGLNINQEYPPDKMRPFIGRINEASIINAKTDEFEISDKEMELIFGLIDYDARGLVSWDEIQIFYFRGLLGV